MKERRRGRNEFKEMGDTKERNERKRGRKEFEEMTRIIERAKEKDREGK